MRIPWTLLKYPAGNARMQNARSPTQSRSYQTLDQPFRYAEKEIEGTEEVREMIVIFVYILFWVLTVNAE